MNYKAPLAMQRFIKSFGGTNPYGQPKWRLVVAGEIFVREAGVWRDWADGLTTAEKGGLNFTPNPDIPGVNYQRYENTPDRVVTEIRDTRKYPESEGWILERWFPASTFGTQENWYAQKSIDGLTPCLGPYPERGDYEFCYGPWEQLPTTDVIQLRISQYTAQINNRTGTPESRLRDYMYRFEYNQRIAEEKRKKEYEAMFKEELTPMNSSSLAASRWRNDLAARTGLRSHVGIGG